MRIVLINQFYPPDVAPTGCYLHDLARALVDNQHEVTVMASRHAYAGGGEFAAREILDGVEVVRLPGFSFGRGTHFGKLADYAAYYARLAGKLLSASRIDLVVSLTTPPFVGLLAKLIAERAGAQHAHWVMDVYPDVLRAHDAVRGIAYAALQQAAKHAYRGASSVITLGPAMADRLRHYASTGTVFDWVPLWSREQLTPWDADNSVGLRIERGWAGDRLTLLYSGNFGLGHRFEEFLAAAARLGPSGPQWAFAGSGRNRPRVERFVADNPRLPMQLLEYVDPQRLREHLCSADVHIISMDSRWEGTLLPSKLQASFAVGKPVIFVGNQSNDMARWVAESGSGWVVAENDVDGLLAAIAAASESETRKRCGDRALAHAREHFNQKRNIGRLVAHLGAA